MPEVDPRRGLEGGCWCEVSSFFLFASPFSFRNPRSGSFHSSFFKLSFSFLYYSGILVPSGFGQRGAEGMRLAVNYAKESKVPFLGILLGIPVGCHLAVIEWVQDVGGSSPPIICRHTIS